MSTSVQDTVMMAARGRGVLLWVGVWATLLLGLVTCAPTSNPTTPEPSPCLQYFISSNETMHGECPTRFTSLNISDVEVLNGSCVRGFSTSTNVPCRLRKYSHYDASDNASYVIGLYCYPLTNTLSSEVQQTVNE